jgi:hypothetical protein
MIRMQWRLRPHDSESLLVEVFAATDGELRRLGELCMPLAVYHLIGGMLLFAAESRPGRLDLEVLGEEAALYPKSADPEFRDGNKPSP